MGILFESNTGTLQVGGTASDPFPRYSISREDARTGGGEALHSKFTISVSGTRTSGADITSPGARQAALMALGNEVSRAAQGGEGKLTIISYSGSTTTFTNCRIVSTDLPEQSDDSAGVQFIEYGITFESFEPASFFLESADESWDVTMNEGPVSFQNHDPDTAPKRTFSMSHTVSATGHRSLSGTALVADGEAWRQAAMWVKSRLTSDPLGHTSSALMGGPDSAFSGNLMDKVAGMGFDGNSMNMEAMNHLRTYNMDHGGGSYSVTDSWMLADKNQAATHDFDISLNIEPEAEANTVTVNGTIQGINTSAVTSAEEDKYANALAGLGAMKAKALPMAQSLHGGSGAARPLRATAVSSSEGHNRATGTVTFSITFDDKEVDTAGAVDEEVTVTYDNIDGGNNVVAIIGVVDNAGGPVIQDMGTTNERKVSVSVDMTMDEDNRASRPLAAAKAKAAAYEPAGSYRQTNTETWNPETGVYNYSISWVYTA